MMFYDLNREDLLELTRRMTVKRSCIFRAAGAYMDKDGEVDGSFNLDSRESTLVSHYHNRLNH